MATVLLPVRISFTAKSFGRLVPRAGQSLPSSERMEHRTVVMVNSPDPLVATFPGAIDVLATTEELEHLADVLPDEWLAASATGSPEQCAGAIAGQFALGVDGVILHGSTPEDLAPVLPAYRAIAAAD